jgi:hypothetical protein
MLDSLKLYDKNTAEYLLARTSFFLEGNSILDNFGPFENEDSIRQEIINEVCTKLKISPNLEKNKKKIDDFIDLELGKSMEIDKETEEKIIVKLSKEGCLPTDLYKVKIGKNIDRVYRSRIKNEIPLIEQTVKRPDLIYNLSSLVSNDQEDISCFAKYYRAEYEYNSFFLLVVGKRDGLNFIVNQAWRIYNDIIRPLSNAFDLLETFVEKFGVEVEFQGKTSKFFSSVIAKNEKEFNIVIDDKKITKAKSGETQLSFFHFIKPMDKGNNRYSLFFVIDLLKYRNYLKKHKSEQAA